MLDMEIAAYRSLLEGEETRLGMSQIEETSDAGNGRCKKRKRMCLEVEAECSMLSTFFTLYHLSYVPQFTH